VAPGRHTGSSAVLGDAETVDVVVAGRVPPTLPPWSLAWPLRIWLLQASPHRRARQAEGPSWASGAAPYHVCRTDQRIGRAIGWAVSRAWCG